MDDRLSGQPSYASVRTRKRSLGVAGASRSTEIIPYAHFQHAAALALLGHLNEARAATQAGLALDPSFTLRRLRVNRSSDNPIYLADGRRIYKGMRMAGVPEG